jgi:hypothetical protein
VIVALIVAALIALVVSAPGTVKLPIRPFTALNDAEVVLPTTVRLVNDPTVVINGWFALVIVALMLAASILLVTVKLPNVPTVVMNGWFADVIVALIVAALIVLVVNVPGTVKLPIRPFTALNDADVVLPTTVRFVNDPTVVING